MTARVYDPAKLSVVLGSIPIHGFAEDKAFEIEFEGEEYRETKDIRGEISLSKIINNAATLTLHLLQNSASNGTLSSFLEANRINDNGMFPIIVKDSGSNTIFACASAYIKQTPNVTYGSEIGTREWAIRATNISKFI